MKLPDRDGSSNPVRCSSFVFCRLTLLAGVLSDPNDSRSGRARHAPPDRLNGQHQSIAVAASLSVLLQVGLLFGDGLSFRVSLPHRKYCIEGGDSRTTELRK
jgi:hypothetical protein